MSDVDSGYRERLTIEELAADCLDVRELNRKGLLKERSVTFRPLLRWPQVATIKGRPICD